jgi:hypothetical protein
LGSRRPFRLRCADSGGSARVFQRNRRRVDTRGPARDAAPPLRLQDERGELPAGRHRHRPRRHRANAGGSEVRVRQSGFYVSAAT